MIIIVGKSIHTLLCPFLAPANLKSLLPDKYIFPPLDAVCNDDWMFEVTHEIAVSNVNVLRHFINPNGGVMLDNGEMLDDGNAGPLVGPYDRVFVILVDSHTLCCGPTLPLTLAECVTYLTYRVNIVDALCRYNYNVSKGKVDGEIMYTINMLVTLVVYKHMRFGEHPCLYTEHTIQAKYQLSCQGKVLSRSQIISMFVKFNMHIFEQCSQWQKE